MLWLPGKSKEETVVFASSSLARPEKEKPKPWETKTCDPSFQVQSGVPRLSRIPVSIRS
jgi:hypothetical protein